MQQYNCGAIYQLTRGTKSPRLCNQTWDLWNWAIDYKVFWKQLLLQENEYSSRLFEQIQDSTNRMDVEHISRSEFFSGYGTSSDRHVCIHSQSSNRDFVHMVSTPLSMCTRCSVCQWRGMFLNAYPPICVTKKSYSNETIQLSSNFDNGTLAQKTSVHRSASTCNSNTKHLKWSSTTKYRDIQSKSRSTTVNCMASIDSKKWLF